VTSKKKFIIFGKTKITKKEEEEVVKTLRSGWIGTGPKVKEFEEIFKRYKKSNYVQALSSCTAALFLSLKSLNLKKNDEVIVPAMTFISTVSTIIQNGAKPILVDIDKKTMNIDENKIEDKITKNTKAIVIVHFAGYPLNMKSIIKISKKYKLKIIEDCAHAIETTIQGKHVGNFGDFGCFSFYPNKNITTGEGGMLISKKLKSLNIIRPMVLHGFTKDAWKRFGANKYSDYDVVNLGYKNNMTDIQASIGVEQFKRIDLMHKKRKKIWKYYSKELKNLPVFLPKDCDPKSKHAYHLYPLVLNKKETRISRNKVIDLLYQSGIGVGIHYKAIPDYTYFKKNLKIDINNYKNAKIVSRNTFSIPLYPHLQSYEIDKIISNLKKIF